jgi:subtilase family serine protease
MPREATLPISTARRSNGERRASLCPRRRHRWKVTTLVAGALLIAASARAQSVRLPDTIPEAVAGLADAGHADANSPLTLEMRFAPKNPNALNALLSDLQNPASPRFHKWLTPEQFASEFGPSAADIAGARRWLAAQGFKVLEATDSRIKCTANVGRAERAFNTRVEKFADGSKFANVIDPAVPKALADTGITILGLNNFATLKPMLRKGGAVSGATAQEASPDFQGGDLIGDHFGPTDFYTFYDESPLLMAGVDASGSLNTCLGIFASSDTETDLIDDFDNDFGVPAVSVSFVFADGNPGFVPDGERELLLDIEWSHSVAPAVPIVAYVQNTAMGIMAAFADAMDAAVSANQCPTINVSYGICNAPKSYYSKTLDGIFARAAAQGQSILVASGDGGSDECGLGHPNVSEIAADPNVTAVGGTQFTPDYNSDGNDVGSTVETAWNETALEGELAETGGGPSSIFPKPSWQFGPGVPNDGHRDVPDVAMLAGIFHPGVFMIDDEGGDPSLIYVGGTSVGAPVWSGIAQLVIQQTSERLGNMNFALYQLGHASQSGAGFRDVTSGTNAIPGLSFVKAVEGFSAGPGYDETTGWGTVDIDDFVNQYGTAPTLPVNAIISVKPASVNFGKVVLGKSKSKTITISNTTKNGETISLAGPILSAPSTYSFKDNCGPQLASKKSCTLTVTFLPTALGATAGELTVPNNAENNAQSASLAGTGK